MKLVLRGYQRAARDAILREFKQGRSTLLVCPTGAGKTICFASLIEHIDGRTMVLAHRDILIDQAASTIRQWTGKLADHEQGERHVCDYHGGLYHPADAVVSTVQSQVSWRNGRRRMEKFVPSEFGLLVLDEAHRATSRSFRACIEHYTQNPKLRYMGCTATPDRTDGTALGQVFDSVAYRYDIADAIEDGWLVPFNIQPIQAQEVDISWVGTTGRDLVARDLDVAMTKGEERFHAIAKPTYAETDGRKTLIFAAGVNHAKLLDELLNGYEPGCSRVITGKTAADERRAMIDGFRKGKFRFLVGVGVPTEGFDVPDIECIAMARPTKSRLLSCQMLGRGTRPLSNLVDSIPDDEQHIMHNGKSCSPQEMRRSLIAESSKPHLLVLEFTLNTGQHSLATPVDILGGRYTDAEIELAKEAMRGKGGSPSEHLEHAREELRKRAERAAERHEHQRVRVTYRKGGTIDPFSIFGVRAPRELGYEHDVPATPKQVGLLKKFKVPTDGLTKRSASTLIGQCMVRVKAGRCTFAQAKILKRNGYGIEVSRAEATVIIDKIAAAQGWGKRRTSTGGSDDT